MLAVMSLYLKGSRAMETRQISTVDSDQIFRIWESNLSNKWPISKEVLISALGVSSPSENYVKIGV